MNLSEELTWRGFVNQTTYKDISALDKGDIRFYWGVDPSADSMTIGNLAAAMMVKHFMKHGHKAVLLVGGATGLIGDPDGKATERDLKSFEEIEANKKAIVAQYQQIFAGMDFEVVDNYDWFSKLGYIEFLRDIGKHVPMRQMMGREFVQTRLSEDGAGISYAEFSYVLIQAYDFLRLNEDKQISLQVCGSDQWGNSIAGVDLIRRKTGREAHVYSAPLIVNKTTGQKFGKSEAGAVWLDPTKTSPTDFYQFWVNSDDQNVEDYLKVFTDLNKAEVDQILADHNSNPGARLAQTRLAEAVTSLVHGDKQMAVARDLTDFLTGKRTIDEADAVLADMRREIASAQSRPGASVVEALVNSGLASSNTDARRLIASNAISINGAKISREEFEPDDFKNGRLLLRRGKAYKDSALIELGE